MPQSPLATTIQTPPTEKAFVGSRCKYFSFVIHKWKSPNKKHIKPQVSPRHTHARAHARTHALMTD
jgi:hypothetical protein